MILVTGATGTIGGFLVPDLVARGAPVRAFVRDAARGAALGGQVAVGDLDDAGTVEAALVGVDQVFLNGGGAVPAVAEQPMAAQQRRVIDAAKAAGVRRIVNLSVIGAEPDAPLACGAHWAIEEYLKASGVDWTILRPNGFMQNFVTGTASFASGGNLVGMYRDGRTAYLDCADIAAVAAHLLTSGEGVGRTYHLTGPAALTQDEIAALLSRTLGRTVRYRDLPPDEFVRDLVEQGLPADFATDVARLQAGVADGSLAEVTDDVPEVLGRPARTFEQFLAANRTLFT
jgi:NAD(P)H dehydrogenase (quinone)